MDIQDQTKLTTPSGHEVVHICHSCGWPFPNSHPSSKHRKAHKRICGTIEGYTTKLTHSQVVASDDDDDDQHHSDKNENEKTPSSMIEKMTIKESGSGTGGIFERSNKSEEDMFSDAVTEFSDTGVSPGVEQRSRDATKLLDSPIEVKEVDDNFEVFETPDALTKEADKTEENVTKTLHNSADTQVRLPDFDTKPIVPLVEDKDGSHKDKFIDPVQPSNTVQTKPDSAKAVHGDTFEGTDNKDKGEEVVYVLSVPTDIPFVDHAETLINDFKDHKTVYSNVSHADREYRTMVDSSEVKTAQVNIQESQTSDNGESSMKSALSEPTNTEFSASDHTVVIEEAKVAETQPPEMSKTILESTDNLSEAEVSHDKHYVITLGEKIETEGDSEELNRKKLESNNVHAQEVIKMAEIDHSVPVLTEAYTQEIVKEHQSSTEAKQNIVESVVTDSKDSSKLGMSESSEKLILEKAEESCDASGVISETVVDEGDGKLMTSQDFCVDASVDSSSRNSLEGNWGSVSVLSTASIDAENAHSGVKSEISVDKRRLGKSDAFEGTYLVEPKEEIVNQIPSEIKGGTVQNTKPPKSEANISNETEGRKRNEEAIAKVTNWSTSENTTTALKNLVSEAKSSNPKQLSTMIEKDEAAEKISEPGKSNLVNQETSPPKYISEGK